MGVSPSATANEIKKAYRALAARYHPDKHRGNELEDLAKEKLAAANAAFENLKDPARRAAYDKERAFGRQTIPNSPIDELQNTGKIVQSIIRTIAVMAVVFFSMRFVRSPRALMVIGIAILIAWFLPRIIKNFRQ